MVGKINEGFLYFWDRPENRRILALFSVNKLSKEFYVNIFFKNNGFFTLIMLGSKGLSDVRNQVFRCGRHVGIPLTKGISEISTAKLAPVLEWSLDSGIFSCKNEVFPLYTK